MTFPTRILPNHIGRASGLPQPPRLPSLHEGASGSAAASPGPRARVENRPRTGKNTGTQKEKSRPVRGGKLFPRHEENCLVSAMRDLSQCVNLAGHALPAPPVPRHVKTPLPNTAPGSAGSILGGDVFAAILAIGDGLA